MKFRNYELHPEVEARLARFMRIAGPFKRSMMVEECQVMGVPSNFCSLVADKLIAAHRACGNLKLEYPFYRWIA